MDRPIEWQAYREEIGRIIRYGAYTLGLAGALASLPFWARVLGPGPRAFTGDGGAIEWVQFSILIVTALLWGWGAYKQERFRFLFLFLACLTSLAAIREMDYLLDHWIPVLSWKAPALLSVSAAVWVVWTGGKLLVWQALQVSAAPSATLLWAGTLVVVLFSQMVGHGPFLTALFAERFVYEHKRLIEEMGEVFGYALILMGTVETLIGCRKRSARLSPAPIRFERSFEYSLRE